MRIPGFAELTPLDVFRHAIEGFFEDDMLTYAAALSYRLLLALFPFVIFMLTLLGALGLPQFFDTLLQQARSALPPDAFQLLARVIGEIQGQHRGGLISFSIVFAVWAAATGVRSLMVALNVAYDVAETRPAWQRFPLSIAYTVGLAGLVIVATGLMLLGPRAVAWFSGQARLPLAAATLWTWLRWPLAVLILLLVFAIIYFVCPDVDQPFRYVTPGSVTGVIIWIMGTFGFSYYVDTFGNYGATYGSLGGMVVLMLYFFVSSAVLLLGAEINATIHPAHSPGVEATPARDESEARGLETAPRRSQAPLP